MNLIIIKSSVYCEYSVLFKMRPLIIQSGLLIKKNIQKGREKLLHLKILEPFHFDVKNISLAKITLTTKKTSHI